MASEAAVGISQVSLLRQDVARAGVDWDSQVPDLGAGGGGVAGNLLAIRIHCELLHRASPIESTKCNSLVGVAALLSL